MKILFVSESFPPRSYGGGEISCALLAYGLAGRDGIRVTVLTSEVPGLKPVERKNGVTIVRRLKTGDGRSSITDNLKRKLHFKRSVRKEIEHLAIQHDMVHFFNITSIVDTERPSFATINSYLNFCPKGNLFYKEESVCSGCGFGKFIGCITNSEYIGKQRLKGYLKYNPLFWLALYHDYKGRKSALQYVDTFFSLSRFITNRLLEEGIPRERIVNVVNIPDIKKSDKRISLKDDLPIITYIGDLGKIKGVELLVRAFNGIEPKARLIIVGDGPEGEKLKNIAGKNVEFLGKVEHDVIHSVYQQSDVIVVPSLWPEPLSRVLLEAAYFGKPLIATNVGGSPEIVKDGYNGYLVKPREEELAAKLKYLVEKPHVLRSMEVNMKRYYRKELTDKRVLCRIINTYQGHSHGKRGCEG